jgi:peptidoglycan/xylan/chitin deacetylase (PgdA/CDA1 family)
LKLKRSIVLFTLVALVLSTLFSNQTFANAEKLVKVYVDGERVGYDVHPQNIKGRVMVPIRKTTEFLNASVLWASKEKKVTVYDGSKKIELFVHKNYVKVNGSKQKIDASPIIHKSRVLLPIRFLTEVFGYNVAWDSSAYSVVIHSRKVQNEISIPILMYHHFSTTERSSTIVHPNEFERQMSYLKSLGYNTITDYDLVLFMQGKKDLPKNPIMITMDDGYESNYLYAYPILKKLNMKATIYVIGSAMRENNHSPNTYGIPKLSWEQAKEMYQAGVIEIQSHTYDMHKKEPTRSGKLAAVIQTPIMINGKLETTEQYEKRVKEDLIKNKQLIEEKVGNKVVSFAYPYGAFSASAEKLLKETGHQMTLTVKPGVNSEGKGPYKLYRINVPSGMSGQDIEKKIQK